MIVALSVVAVVAPVAVSEVVVEQLRPAVEMSAEPAEPVAPAGWLHSTVHASPTTDRRPGMHCGFAELLVRVQEQVSAYSQEPGPAGLR